MILEAEQEEMEGLNELDLARWHQSVAWARLAKLTTQVLAGKKIKAKYRVKGPSDEDMDPLLHQFDHARPIRLASRRYRIQPSPEPKPKPMAKAIPKPGPEPQIVHRPKPRPLAPDDQFTAEELAEILGPDPMDIDRPAPASGHDSDNLSDIPDEDLILDAIPETEVNRIFRSFGPRRPYREDSDLGSNDEGEGPNNQPQNNQEHATHNTPQTQQPLSQTQYHNLHHPHLQITGPAEDQDQQTQTQTQFHHFDPAHESELETEYDDSTDSDSGPDSDDEDDIFGNYPVRVSSAVNQFPVNIYDVAPGMRTTYYTPATATAMDVDDMLIALAEMPYSGDEMEDNAVEARVVEGGGAGEPNGSDSNGEEEEDEEEDDDEDDEDDPEGEYDGYATYEEWAQYNSVYDLPVVLGSDDGRDAVIDHAAAAEADADAEAEADADADADADMQMNGPDFDDDDEDDDAVPAVPAVQLPVQGFEDVAGINELMNELTVVPGSSQDQDMGQDQDGAETMDPAAQGESGEDQKILKLRDWYRPW